MIKKTIIFGAIFFITFSICSFIHFSNDHKEYRNEINSKLDSKENLVKEKVHICKEKYNF